MSFYNKFLTTFLFPLSEILIKDKMYSEFVKLKKTFSYDEAKLEKIQTKNLNNILINACQKVPFYKGLNINLKNNPFIDLKKFPVIDKSTLRDFSDNLISEEYEKNKLLKHVSSGSSGVQSTVFWTVKQQSQNRAIQMLWWHWAGYFFGKPVLQTGITPNRGFLKKIKDIILRTKYVSAFTHSNLDIKKNLEWAKDKNAFLAGYASSIYVFSKFSSENNIKTKFSGSISWGDKLFQHYKDLINSEFQVKIKETYASAEGLMIGAQYDLDFMYIMSPFVYVEILDESGVEVNDGEMGNVVITCLNAFAMPLIRYKIGDLAIKLPQNEYPSNRKLGLPLFKKVIGRDTDIIQTKSGNKMVVHSFTGIFEHYSEIIQFCIIQNDLSSILIQVIVERSFNKIILKNITEKINNYSLGELEIKFELVNYIPPTQSGKPQIIISNIK
tara:strand:- start:882 stop:2204 length:1323 start_codon:yes stop_codon:yes gene_type:complete